MNLFFLSSRFRRLSVLHRLSVPGTMLMALLQRTPVVRVAAVAESAVVSSPVANVVRSTLAAAASLGAIQSMAGATNLVPTQGTAAGISTTVGATVSVGFSVTGTQTPPASWRVSGAFAPGLTFSGLTSNGVVNVQTLTLSGSPTTAGTYTVTINAYEGTNASLTESPPYSYTVTVTGSSATAPSITTQPQSQTVTAGANVSLSVAASGTPTPTYQWRKDGADISGATSSTLTLNNAQPANGGSYTVVVTNSAGSVTSNAATVTVNAATSAAPVFTQQPVSHTIATGSTVTFTAQATGATSYRWQRNGADVSGGTDATLVISNASAASAGTYTAIATNSGGSTTSSAATLAVGSVAASDAGRLINLSVRTFSGSGAQVLNVGFVTGGAGTSGTKPLLIRVGGPFLTQFGLNGTMVDPTLSVSPLGSTTVVASNDDWAGNATVSSTATAVSAFPWTATTSKDAATVASLSGGTYTVLAAGKADTSGLVLTEIYDATPSSSVTAATPRLVNVSARAQVSPGDGVLIAGFVIAGNTSKTLLIRAIGPGIAAYGVPGTLADPKLEVYKVPEGTKLYENDNWGGSTLLTNVGNGVSAFAIPDLASKDAMLLVTLPPGGYTAQVSGPSSGIALVEVYEVP
jgi:hypothetical protein